MFFYRFDKNKTKLKRFYSILRPDLVDVTTPKGRSDDRYRRAAWTTIANISAQGVSIVTGLISIPLTIHYLGTERFGLWMTITAMVSMLQFADLGIGNGLINKIADANGRDEKEDIRAMISNGVVMLALMALFIISVFSIMNMFISWPAIFNAQTPETIADAGPTTVVLVIIFAINIMFGIITKINLALQRGYVNGVYQIIGSLIGLFAVIISIKIKAGLPLLVASYMSAPVIAILVNGLYMFFRTHAWARPSLGYFDFTVVCKLMNLGFWFLVFQIVFSLNSSIPNFVISHTLGLDKVAIFAVTVKLSSVAVVLQTAILGPLWPAYAEAKSRGDWRWIKSTLLRSLKLSGIIGLLAAVMIILFGSAIITLWIDKATVPSQSVLWAFGAWVLLNSLYGPIAMFLTGMGMIKIQALYSIILITFMLILCIILTGFYDLSGAAWSLGLAYTMPSLVLACIITKRILSGEI